MRRRIDDALASASPLALAEAMDAHICSRSRQELRDVIASSVKRMDADARAQLDLYVDLDAPDDLLGNRFSAFLRQNPRAIAALDPPAIDAILADLGEVPPVERVTRRLPAPTVALLALVLAIAVLPLAAQYAHQRGIIAGTTSEQIMPPPIVPFVQQIAARPARKAPHPKKRPAHRSVHHRLAVAPHRRPVHIRRAIAAVPRAHRPAAIPWKFDRRNNPYFNRLRWRHPYVADDSQFGQRARLTVRSYLRAVVHGNLTAALVHLGLPAGSNTSAIAELPIVSRGSMVAIVGSKPQAGGKEQVQADIVTGRREYFEVFSVARDGPAARIVDHYYIPVNRHAQVATRATRTE